MKVQAGEEVVFRLLDMPLLMRQHSGDQATGTFPAICSREEHGACPICEDTTATDRRRKASFLASAPVYVHAVKHAGAAKGEAVKEVRVFEYGVKVQADLQNLTAEWDWKATDFKLRREGSGQMDTKYFLTPTSKAMPVPADVPAPDLEAHYLEQMKKTLMNGAPTGPSLHDETPQPGVIPDSYPDPFAEE